MALVVTQIATGKVFNSGGRPLELDMYTGVETATGTGSQQLKAGVANKRNCVYGMYIYVTVAAGDIIIYSDTDIIFQRNFAQNEGKYFDFSNTPLVTYQGDALMISKSVGTVDYFTTFWSRLED